MLNGNIFVKAINDNDLEQVRKILLQGTNVNEKFQISSSYHFYPICYAILNKNKNIIRELISAGVDLSISHSHNFSLLKSNCIKNLMDFICITQDNSLLSLMLSKGFNPNLKFITTQLDGSCFHSVLKNERWIQYPLNIATKMGSVEIAKTLIESGAMIEKDEIHKIIRKNAKDIKKKFSNLHIALKEDRYEMVFFCLKIMQILIKNLV
jgi:ankyrin repeat protein